jgi:hypothetical protein
VSFNYSRFIHLTTILSFFLSFFLFCTEIPHFGILDSDTQAEIKRVAKAMLEQRDRMPKTFTQFKYERQQYECKCALLLSYLSFFLQSPWHSEFSSVWS